MSLENNGIRGKGDDGFRGLRWDGVWVNITHTGNPSVESIVVGV